MIWVFSHLLHSQTVVRSFVHAGKTRSYRLHIPQPFPSGPMPLVFSLHGYTSDGLQQEFYSQFSPLADAEHFLVVYPDGIGNYWDVGFLPDNSDDVGFLSALIDTIAQDYQVDLTRVYSCGFSLGGYMSYRLGCELTDRFAAIAPVSGLMAMGVYANCTPSRQLPVMHIHGTADDVVPTSGLFSPSVDSVIAKWSRIDGCQAVADTFYQPDVFAGDSSTAIRYTYPGCADSTELIYWQIAGGGHTWPGAFPLQGLVTNFDINATQKIWNFFSRHRNPAPRPVTGISKVYAERVMAYWSPEAGGVVIDSQEPFSAEIIDLQGRSISQYTTKPAGKTVIDSQNLTPGYYFCRWSTAHETGIVKLIR